MGEMPLVLRRYKLGLKYLMKLKGQREVLPTKYLLSDHWEFMGIRNTKTNFAENLKSVAQEIGIRDVSETLFSSVSLSCSVMADPSSQC